MQHDAESLLEKLRPQVSTRDFDVIVKRFGLDGEQALSLAEVAEKYEVTRARVHQIEKKLLVNCVSWLPFDREEHNKGPATAGLFLFADPRLF